MEEIFWSTISNYNMTTWILQLAICICGLALTILIYIKPNKFTRIMLKAYLSFCFGWLAVVFFMINGSNQLNKNTTAALFGLIALLWLVDICANKLKFIRNMKYDRLAIVLYLMFLSYPIVSLFLGKSFPGIITYLMPCPLTVYAITLLISFSTRIDYKVLFLLILWALTGLPKIFMFNVPEDIILFISGICALFVFAPMVYRAKAGAHNIDVSEGGYRDQSAV